MVRQTICQNEMPLISVSKKFPAVFVAMLGSTIPIGILGVKFAMAVTPFWAPVQFSKATFLRSKKLPRQFFFSSYSGHALW